MTISVGDTIPALTLKTPGEKGPEDITTDHIFKGKKVVLFAVPGAFTPGCSLSHLPGYVTNADRIKAKGVDTIVCMAVNDAFVLGAWSKDQNADALLMLADGNGELTKQLGLEMDATGHGMGMRCQRFALVAEDGVVTHLAIEPEGKVDVSAAEKTLEIL